MRDLWICSFTGVSWRYVTVQTTYTSAGPLSKQLLHTKEVFEMHGANTQAPTSACMLYSTAVVRRRRQTATQELLL